MKIIVAGDYCPCNRIKDAFESNNYAQVFSDVVNVTSRADYSIVNLECPIVLSNTLAIEKVGPNLRCNEHGVDALKYAGYDCVTLANNHFFDYGEKGVNDTISVLTQHKIDYIGGGRNLLEASQTLYKNISGIKLAIINCCEHEFSIATATSSGCNPLNPISQYYAILEARKKADVVLVIVHGGHEHYQLPSPRMVETYRFFIDAGADVVVNHHQHCYSGYEEYKGKLIFYGLGNFCFDNPAKHSGIWTEGYMVMIDFASKAPSFEIHPYRQCAENARVEMLPKDAFEANINELNAIIANSKALQAAINDYYTKCAYTYSNVFEPIRNRYYLGAKRRGWLPSFIGKKRMIEAFNYINCESHRDKMLFWLDNKK